MNNLQEFSGFKVGYKEEGHEYKEEEEEHFENPTPKDLMKLNRFLTCMIAIKRKKQ